MSAIWITFFIILLSIWQIIVNEKKSMQKDLLFKREQERRDSAITVGIKTGVDSSSRKLFEDISIALAKQGFELDRARMELKAINNSPRVINYNAATPIPQIILDKDAVSHEVSGTTTWFRVKITASQETALIHFEDYYYFEVKYIDDIKGPLQKMSHAKKSVTIPKDRKFVFEFFIATTVPIKDISILLSGECSNLTKTSIKKFKECYNYDLTSRMTTYLSDSEKKELLSLIKK